MILCDDNRARETKDKQSMAICERCGNDIPDNLAICPNCGTVTSKAKDNVSPTTSYGSYSDRYSTPLIVELLFSIFLGIFGIGWLMAGEVVIGIILLVCSLFIYLPLLIISIFIAFFTFGFSLFCTGPMVIGAIVLNAILLNNKLKRKASTYTPIPPN
jgi:hypothetical protein